MTTPLRLHLKGLRNRAEQSCRRLASRGGRVRVEEVILLLTRPRIREASRRARPWRQASRETLRFALAAAHQWEPRKRPSCPRCLWRSGGPSTSEAASRAKYRVGPAKWVVFPAAPFESTRGGATPDRSRQEVFRPPRF